MPRRSLLEHLDNFYRLGPEIAYVHQRGYRRVHWSYREVAETASQVARELQALQIGAGDYVGLWGDNCAEWVAAFFGCLLRGAVVVPMDRIASPKFALRVFREVGARLLLGSREQLQLASGIPTLPLETLREAVAHQSKASYEAARVERQHKVEIVFTSGTTDEPKGVVITHGNILSNLEPLEAEINKYLKYERLVHPLRFLTLVPLSHVFGQFLGLFVPSLLRSTVIFQDRLNPSDILRTVKRQQVSVVGAVPRLLDTLKDKLERDFEAEGQLEWFHQQLEATAGEHPLKRLWRFRRIHSRLGWKFWAFVSGGATLDRVTEAFWTRLGFGVIQGYGLTETSSLVSVNHPFHLSRGSVGKVLPGRELKLAENGEILVRGESIASTSWQGRELKLAQISEGWFHTGDIGKLDEEGNLYFKGRRKNVIVTAEGMNIYPEDLEAVLRQQPEVRDCTVVVLERDGKAEPCAVLLLRGGSETPEAIVRRANQSLAKYQHIRHWFTWPEEDFPRTGTQKPRTSVIKEVVKAQLGRPVASNSIASRGAVAGPGGLAEMIARITGRRLSALPPTAALEGDLNLSSLDQVQLLSALEDRYQVDLHETRFTSATTVADLERMVRQPGPLPSKLHFPRWAQRWPLQWIRVVVYSLLVWPATLLLGCARVRGRKNLLGIEGPVLVVCNHTARVDVMFVLAALPARLRHRLAVAAQAERLEAMRRPAKEGGFLRGWLDRPGYWLAVALFNVFPLPRRSSFRESFQFAGESVDRGYSVLVFPEGEVTPDGRLLPFRLGIGLLANNLNIPIVPLRIEGLFELKRAGRKLARPGAVQVTIGSPLRFQLEIDPSAIARELQAAVAALGGAGQP